MARIALEEERQRKVEEKRERVQSVRKEREKSKKRAADEHKAARDDLIRSSKQQLAERKQALEIKEKQQRAKKLKIAAEVKKSKQEAAAKKMADQEVYQNSVHDSYIKKIQEQESIYSANQQVLSELENEERHMVDKLNMTRMSALSGHSANRNNRSINMGSAKKQGGGSSPFQDVR